MQRILSVIFLFMVLPSQLCSSGTITEGSDIVSSPVVSKVFYEIAYELANSQQISPADIEEAIIFLNAATKLDNVSGSEPVRLLMLELACSAPGKDYSSLINDSLISYVDRNADIEIAKRAITYLLEKCNSMQQREELLKQMLITIGNKNNVIGSQLALLLGNLKAEEPDLEAAEFYLVQAYQNNRYDNLALERLGEIVPDQIGPAVYLERARLALREDPTNIESIISFAQKAEEFQIYATAADAYEYCADLFEYLYPSEPLPDVIYLPWSICCYNTEQKFGKCLEIATLVREQGRFDLLADAIAGKVALKIQEAGLAKLVLDDAENKALELMNSRQQSGDTNSQSIPNNRFVENGAQQLAWFYSFVRENPVKALQWANRAFSSDTNSPSIASLLAYALVLNDEEDSAESLLDVYGSNQISDLAMAQIQLNRGQRASAIELLLSVVEQDPGSFAAEKAKELLTQQGQTYTPKVTPQAVIAVMESNFGGQLVPSFIPPEEILSVEFDTSGSEFPYGTEFDGVVTITNKSTEPLVISDDALFKGNVRIDAEISGDLNVSIPNLYSRKVSTANLIEPGGSMSVPIRLFIGELRRTLLSFPQASLDITFTLYLDPVKTDTGRVVNRLTYITPLQVQIHRPRIDLTNEYLTELFNGLAVQGRMTQKVETADVFTGLLNEHFAFSNRTPPYQLMYSEGMIDLLKTGLTHERGLLLNQDDADWVVKVYAMSKMLSMPLDFKQADLVQAVTENLNDGNWPVRLMAAYLLAKSQDSRFNEVLSWMADNDPNQNVRDMVTLLNTSR